MKQLKKDVLTSVLDAETIPAIVNKLVRAGVLSSERVIEVEFILFQQVYIETLS